VPFFLSILTKSTFYCRTYRGELLRNVIDVYKGAEMPDYVSMVQCLIILDDPNAVALVLETLSQGSAEDVLMSYQV
jgi:26S proteasome regulatory subunit N2